MTRPSRLYLSKLESPPATIFEHLISRFPQVSTSVWRSRVSRGLVTLSDGTTLREDSPYRHGMMVFYRKEVPAEPESAEDAVIIYRDENILVVDKPHGMPVTPAGQYLDRSLIVHLERNTGLSTLAPMHRLDRETAGLVLFAIKTDIRGQYHQLFSDRVVEREYFAVAHITEAPTRTHWRLENRLESGEPWFRQRIVEGAANAITEIELLESRDGIGLFRLFPKTGKKHQLRLHMASIGYPIVGDPFYPSIRQKADDEVPLQLLAARVAFVDPLTREARTFTSPRRLRW